MDFIVSSPSEGGTKKQTQICFFRASAVCFSGPVCFFGGREAHFPGRGLDGKRARIKKAACPDGHPPNYRKSTRFIDKTHMGNPDSQNLIKPVVY